MPKTETIKAVDMFAEKTLLKRLIEQWKTCPGGRFTSMQIVLYAVLEYLEFDPERVYKVIDAEYLSKRSTDWIVIMLTK